MEKYDLAKLVEWAGELRTRKKMQKIVFLLQYAGCPFEADFGLLHFGPYSSDVAQTTDQMVQLGLLEEECVGNLAGRQFNYRLTEQAKANLNALEQTERGRVAAQRLCPFDQLAKQLINEDVRRLEIASTIAYFLQHGDDWDSAIEETCKFKSLGPDSPLLSRSEDLVRQILG